MDELTEDQLDLVEVTTAALGFSGLKLLIVEYVAIEFMAAYNIAIKDCPRTH